ncbi:MAG: AMP-binding protein [Methanomassiliicoccaceae archaeon]|jgi:long-chain acyl-CoA synthetase|nr:AMP-binding protein [Methanomassiliicoccaceae archaeon]
MSCAPWLKHYGNVPSTLRYPEGSIFDVLEKAADGHEEECAYEFMGRKVTYSKLISDIVTASSSLRQMGIGKGDRVMICLPNVPQAVTMFYAISRIGAVAVMVHPLSSKNEIEFYINNSGCRIAITLDRFCKAFEGLQSTTSLKKLVVVDISKDLGPLMRAAYRLRSKVPKAEMEPHMVAWKDMMSMAKEDAARTKVSSKDVAVTLYTGGTTGTPKGVLISNLSFNATALQTYTMGEYEITKEDSMLGVLPMFHGFGLCIGMHMTLMLSAKLILVPVFSPEAYSKLIKRKRPTFIAGVPTMFELMIRNKRLKGADLSFLRGVFAGGDTLTVDLKRRVEKFLRDHGSSSTIREGYGLTESVTASCLTPKNEYRPGSIGIPFPDTFYKVVAVGTTDEVPYGTDGEICISGPSVMIGYNNEPDETANVLKIHDDGRTWLHTGDAGMMDPEGFIYFRQRIKRMIISSGYNIYPSQIENVLDSHPFVQSSCVIGVPDEIRIQSVKAFIVLRGDVREDASTKQKITEHCKENMAKYAVPSSIEFIEELPKTRVGKVAYTELEKLETSRKGLSPQEQITSE